MTRRLLPTLLILIFAAVVYARNVRTTRNPSSGATADTSVGVDTIIPSPTDVTVSGYNKPLRATRESLFITNNTDTHIVTTVLTIGYFDSDSTMIHSRTVRINTPIPPGQTRNATFPSWDRQTSFYFISSPPSRAAGIPYFIRQSVDTIFVNRQL